VDFTESKSTRRNLADTVHELAKARDEVLQLKQLQQIDRLMLFTNQQVVGAFHHQSLQISADLDRLQATIALQVGQLERKERQRSRAANAEDFYRERAKQLSSENTAITDTLLEAQSTGKRQRCEVTLTLLEEVRTAKLGRDIAERGVEFWRLQPRGTGDARDLELFTAD